MTDFLHERRARRARRRKPETKTQSGSERSTERDDDTSTGDTGNVTVMPPDASSEAAPDGIPPHVWQTLQDAGEMAATRLLEILRSPDFHKHAPAARRGLIELAMTRAYGLPVRKSLSVSLSSSDADAVAASLNDLAQHLPEAPQDGPQGRGQGEDTDDT